MEPFILGECVKDKKSLIRMLKNFTLQTTNLFNRLMITSGTIHYVLASLNIPTNIRYSDRENENERIKIHGFLESLSYSFIFNPKFQRRLCVLGAIV